jgi:hypothetical protein
MRHAARQLRSWLIFEVGRKMKTCVFLLTLVQISSGCATRPSQLAVTTASLESAATTIVGVLGLPLGTVAEIEAVVVPVPPRPIIGPARQWYGLRIEAINGDDHSPNRRCVMAAIDKRSVTRP